MIVSSQSVNLRISHFRSQLPCLYYVMLESFLEDAVIIKPVILAASRDTKKSNERTLFNSLYEYTVTHMVTLKATL